MDAAEVAARRGEMTPFQLEHARIGMADAISSAIGRGGKVVGNANVANSQMLNSPEGQRRIAAMFDTPEQAADFLGTVTTQNQLMRNASGWGGGSTSYSNFAHGEDNAMAAVDAVVDVARGDIGRAVSKTGRQIGNFLTNDAIERGNNVAGEALLRRIDGPEAKAFTDEVVRLLRERASTRRTNATVTRIGAAAAGVGAAKARKRP
jgi:hypothetical protein